MTLTVDELREIVNYDPETGTFTWRRPRQKCRAGGVAGSIQRLPNANYLSYWKIGILGREYTAHRLAWLYVTGDWPEREIDHINGNGLDNRISNLRPCNRSENLQNTKIRADNTSGFIGVSWNNQKNKWHARIGVGKKMKNLGFCDSPEEAFKLYEAAKLIYHTFQPTQRAA